MKRCPTCNRNYTDDSIGFCLDDGTPLVEAGSGSQPLGSGGGIKPPQSHISEPPPTVAFQASPPPPPSWSPPSAPPPRKRRVWPWVVGILGVLAVLGIGFIVLIVALASMASNSNNSNNSNRLSNSNNYNNSNLANSNRPVLNSNTNQQNSSTNTSSNTATGDIYIKNIYMARDNGSGSVGEQTDSFVASDRTIHCVAELNKSQSGTQVKFSWYAVDAGGLHNELIKDLDYNTGALENKVQAHLTLPRDWPTGSYRVDVYINGQKGRSINYEIE